MRNPRRNPWLGGGAHDNVRRRRGSQHLNNAATTPFGSPGATHDVDDTGDTDDQIGPTDLWAVRADDELLDALASDHLAGSQPRRLPDGDGQPRSSSADLGDYSDDQALFAMLQSWRDDVDAEPIPDLISLDEAAAVIQSGRRPRRRLMPVAAAAAAVCVLAGLGIATGNATPDSPLWNLSTLVNSQRAHAVQASYNANIALVAAQKALETGDVAGAKAELAKAAPQLARINDVAQRRALTARQKNLTDTAEMASPGESVRTDSRGVPLDRDTNQRYRNHRWHDGDRDEPAQGPGTTPDRSPDTDRQTGPAPLPDGRDPRVLQLHSDQADSATPDRPARPHEQSAQPGRDRSGGTQTEPNQKPHQPGQDGSTPSGTSDAGSDRTDGTAPKPEGSKPGDTGPHGGHHGDGNHDTGSGTTSNHNDAGRDDGGHDHHTGGHDHGGGHDNGGGHDDGGGGHHGGGGHSEGAPDPPR